MVTAHKHRNGYHTRIQSAEQTEINVGQTERIASLAAGGLLALYSLLRPGRASLLWMAMGAGLLYRGSSGYCALYDALGISTAEPEPTAHIEAANQSFEALPEDGNEQSRRWNF